MRRRYPYSSPPLRVHDRRAVRRPVQLRTCMPNIRSLVITRAVTAPVNPYAGVSHIRSPIPTKLEAILIPFSCFFAKEDWRAFLSIGVANVTKDKLYSCE